MDYNIDLDNSSYKKRLEVLRALLETERSSFVPHWRDLADYILPTRGRFFITDSNNGERRNLNIIDSTATLAIRTLRAGMMAGITSPARPWFKLVTDDPSMNKSGNIKAWLSEVEELMRSLFLRSNLYNALPIIYGDMGTFGTSAVFMDRDFEYGVRFYTFPIGSYMLANDEKGKIAVFYREFQMTVRQIIEMFARDKQTGKIDWSNISHATRNLWERGQQDHWVQVSHVVKKNERHNPNKLESKFKNIHLITMREGYLV